MIIDVYFLIPAVIAHVFDPAAELLMPIGIPTNEANAEMETQPVTTEISECSTQLKCLHAFLHFLLTNALFYFFQKIVSCFIYCLNSKLASSFVIFVFKVLIYYLVILFMVIKKVSKVKCVGKKL